MAAPLPERMRPRSLDEVVGQAHLLAPGRPLRRLLEAGELRSVILFGPPGCGKTTIARLLAAQGHARFVALSAVLSGTPQLREAIAEAKAQDGDTVLFVDEIHRWNKAQQDALLPHVEDGTITLIGATTENPSHQVRRTLLSRSELVRLKGLEDADLEALVSRALTDTERGLGARSLTLEPDVLTLIVRMAQGDGRSALGILERLADGMKDGQALGLDAASALLGRDEVLLTLDDDEHYALASALIKSMRGSDPDASLYWLARLMESGEPPAFIARRLMIFASEDIGNADPQALILATSASMAVERIGMPEGRLILGQAVSYLACAPKSNASYAAINAALKEVRFSGRLPVPLHLKNPSSSEERQAGVGKGYRYPHDHPFGVVKQDYMPDKLRERRFYEPKPWANEKTIADRLGWWKRKLDDG